MDGREIATIMTRLFRNSRVNFLGVFASDQIPSLPAIHSLSPCCYIVNTDPTGKLGTHWLAFFHPCAKNLEFFDSFGFSPSEFGFHFPTSIHVYSNSIQVQSKYSSTCGYHCIYFLFSRTHGIPLSKIISKLKSFTLVDSDRFGLSFIRKII